MPVAIMFLTATIWGIPGQYTLTIGAAVFRSAKMVLIPLYVTGTACLLNVFGDLAFGLGWGAQRGSPTPRSSRSPSGPRSCCSC